MSEGDPKFYARNRKEIDPWIERRMFDELNAWREGAVRRHRNIPVGLEAVLVALPAAGKNVVERLRPHPGNRQFAADAEGTKQRQAGHGGIAGKGRGYAA